MKNLSTLISEYIKEVFEVTKEEAYDGYDDGYWYVVRGCSGDVFIGINTRSEVVNSHVTSELGWYLYGECRDWIGNITIVVGEFSDYSERISNFLSGK